MDAQAMIARAKAVRARLMTPPNGRVSSELEIVSEAIQRRKAVLDAERLKREKEAQEAFDRQLARDMAAEQQRTAAINLTEWISAISATIKGTPHLSFRRIFRTVADHYNVQYNLLLSARRTHQLTHPRHVAFYLCRGMTTLTLSQIARFARRDHTTVMHGAERIHRLLETDEKLQADVAAIRAKIQGE